MQARLAGCEEKKVPLREKEAELIMEENYDTTPEPASCLHACICYSNNQQTKQEMHERKMKSAAAEEQIRLTLRLVLLHNLLL